MEKMSSRYLRYHDNDQAECNQVHPVTATFSL